MIEDIEYYNVKDTINKYIINGFCGFLMLRLDIENMEECSMSLMDTYWTAKKIMVKEETPKQIRMKANEYTKGFKSVLVHIGLGENIGWYRSDERDIDNRSYIFGGRRWR